MSNSGEQKPDNLGAPGKTEGKAQVKPSAKPKPAGKPKAAKAKSSPTAKPSVAKVAKTGVKKTTAKQVNSSKSINPSVVANPARPAPVSQPAPTVTLAPSSASKSANMPKPIDTPRSAAMPEPPPALPRKPSAKPTAKSTGWSQRLVIYAQLMRLNRPIGILLLLWPTLWSLWLAAGGFPRWDLLIIFTLGVVLMRSAGCVINDFADRRIDGHVARTKERPLATGRVSSREALGLFTVLCVMAFGLVLMTNTLTIWLSLGGLALAACYPFMKRHTHLPQVVLGAAFAWSIPMAFAAQSGALATELWLIYLAVVLWTVVYDTFYAMVDRDDDKRIGVKSTAILFGEHDRIMTGCLQVLALYALVLMGGRFEMGVTYYLSLVVVAGLFVYQQFLIRFREREACFRAFLNNHWVGMAVFVGIVVDLGLKVPH